MTYGHLQADCLYTGISSGPNARCRVWEAFTFFNLGLVISPFRNTDRNQNQIQSNRKHIYTYSALRHEWEVQKDNSAKESLTEASIPCWCMFDCWRKQKFINNTRLGSHWIHNQQCTSVSVETRHEQQSLNQKQLERCNPWPHIANRHISISQQPASQLFSLWHHSLLSRRRPALRTGPSLPLPPFSISKHPQLRTGGFCWAKIYCPHALADGN